MTFSIVARDPETGDLGVAVASKFLAAGSVVSHATALVGAVATQALANYSYGPEGLALLAQGLSAAEVVERLVDADEGRDHRQLGIVDATGHSATYTGSACIDWAGGRTADGVAVQGNILAGEAVVDAMLGAYQAPGLPFPERLVEALKAADAQGGDRRGRQSAAVLVKRDKGGYGGNNDSWIDLRVDDDPSPMTRLADMLELVRLYRDRPAVEDLVAIDDAVALELRRLLTTTGFAPESLPADRTLAEVLAGADVARTGEPREAPSSWDGAWENALAEWISVENLEERMAARGWIDPRVLAFLRAKAGGAVG
jgi:uncharacterized Ntn-hydrolase superfamily protein